MESVRARIGKRTVDAVRTPAAGEVRLWDTDLKGFFLRTYASGRRVYAVKYRLGPLQRIYTIGTHGSPWTPEQARAAADKALQRVKAGEDPAAAKQEARRALTVAALIEAYLADGPATKPAKRASTWANDGSNLKRHVKPLLGRKVANAVTKADAAKAIADIAAGKTAADEKTGPRGRARVLGGQGVARRTRAAAAAMFAWGVEHGLIASNNPFAGVKLAAAPMRERFLSREESGRLLDAIAAMETDNSLSKTFGDALRLLMLTGARKSEILGLKWPEVDFERQRLVLPPQRTKAGGQTGERRIVLSPPALAILKARLDAAEAARKAAADNGKGAGASPYVFPGYRGDGHATGLRKAFGAVCAKAELPGVRLHDLRHSFASFAIADGASLFLVGKLLGHASARTTERYSHLSADPLQDAAAMVGRRIMGEAPPEGATVARLADYATTRR
ncbi:MAG TPA: site-specific integrase [Caulobacteraceae bacterium]|nr:site-specific integrase [Caulobacteraceae bacterium]